jgi:hypothetical protein
MDALDVGAAREAFGVHLAREFGSENLEFYRAASDFKAFAGCVLSCF